MTISNDFRSGRAYAPTALGLLFSVMSLPAWADGNPITALQAQVAALQQTVGAQAQQITSLSQAVTTLSNTVNAQNSQITALQSLKPLAAVLSYDSVSKTITVTGVNVQIVNGMGTTPTTNSFGNLIIGYNEADTDTRGVCSTGAAFDTFQARCTADGGTLTRTLSGSHNLVIGTGHGFSQYGGMVVGQDNLISGPFAVVSGGDLNTAGGQWSSVSGGDLNTASGGSSSVSGGGGSTASGAGSSVSGGASNTASGVLSSVSGGGFNTASGLFSSVSGGAIFTESTESGWAAGGVFHNP
jgi:hypothetical protein